MLGGRFQSCESRVAEVGARIAGFEAALHLLGMDNPDAELVKTALVRARGRAPVGKRIDSRFQLVERVKKQIGRDQERKNQAQEDQGSTGKICGKVAES